MAIQVIGGENLMKHKQNIFCIRDRLLSLFAAIAVLAGIFTGFAHDESVSADSHVVIIDENSEIEYKEELGLVVYTKNHKLAETDIRYYTKYFILALDTISTSTDLSDVMPYNEYVLNGRKIDTTKYKPRMLRFDLQFKPGEEGESMDPKDIDPNLDFYWWDKVDKIHDKVITTYYFKSDFIYDFIEGCGNSSTDKVYINHVFAMKWPGTSGESVCKKDKYDPYWSIESILSGVSWSNKKLIREGMEKCINVRVPLYKKATVTAKYYDVTSGNIIATRSLPNYEMLNGAHDGFSRSQTIEVLIDSVVSGDDHVPYSVVTDSSKFGGKVPFYTWSAENDKAATKYQNYSSAQQVVTIREAVEKISANRTIWLKRDYALKANGPKQYKTTLDASFLSIRTNTIVVLIPVKSSGADIFVNFYDKDTGKGFSSIEAVQVAGADAGATSTKRQFEVPQSLASEYELSSSGAFDVHGKDADKVKKYSDAKGMSTKKEGKYAPLDTSYTITESIVADNTYCIWIPLQKKTPERQVWVGFFDADTMTQVGTPFQKSFTKPVKEGDKNLNVGIELPSGTEYSGYAIKNTGAFDIPAAKISNVISYATAKNSTAKRTGTFTGSNYTISEIPAGKDVIVWIPLTKGTGTPINVYIQYVTNTGTSLKSFKAGDTATIGTEYTHTAESLITYNGKTYAPANESQYGSRAPRALYSTTSNDMSSASYNGTYKNNRYDVTRLNLKYSFTPTVADTKAVKLFVPYVEVDNKKTNVRIEYINSMTGETVGSVVESDDYRRGDTIIPSTKLPSGYAVDLSESAVYKRLAVYKEGSDGIKSGYSDAKSKIPAKLTNLDFNSADNCNCDIPLLDDEKLAVKVFVPVKPNINGTMLVVKYFTIGTNGKYKQIGSNIIPNRNSPTGRYAWESNYTVDILSSVYADGKVYEPSYCEGMIYGDSNQYLVAASEPYSKILEKTHDDGVFGTAYAVINKAESQLTFTTASEGSWHTAYIVCNEKETKTKLVIHYIDAESGDLLYTKTDAEYLKPQNKRMTWQSIEGSLVWTYSLSGALDKTIMADNGKTYSPVYFDDSYVTEHTCKGTDVQNHWYMHTEANPYPFGMMWILGYCKTCGEIVEYTTDSLDIDGWAGTQRSTYEHGAWRTYNYPSSWKKTRISVSSPSEGELPSFDRSYGECSDAKFNFWVNDDGTLAYYVKATDNNSLNYGLSSEDQSPEKKVNGTAMVLYVPCVEGGDEKSYNVSVKYITLKSDGSADKVIAEKDGGKAVLGETYTYTGASSVTKDGVTYSVMGKDEWLAYGSNKYGQAKDDSSNVKGNPATYDGGNSWTTKKTYSQEKDGTLYIPVAPAVKVTVKYVTLKSGNKIKKTIATVDGGFAEYGKKYSYTGDVTVKDSSGKEYVIVGSGEALAYGSNSYADALTDADNKKGHKSKFDGADTWKSAKKYSSYEDGTLYIPVNTGVPVTIIYFTPHTGGPNTINDKVTVKSEEGVPSVPGQTYKTTILPTVTKGEDTYQVADASKTGITWPTSGKTEKVWDYNNDTNVRTGTKITADIPSDADEFYILVPVRKIDSPGPEPIDPDDDKVSGAWDPTPKAVIKSDIYDVEKAIPSSEYVYSEITTDKYVLGVKLKNVTGSKTYSMTVNQTVHSMDPDDPEKEVGKSTLSATGSVTRYYDYWVIDDLLLYGPSEAWVRNASVEDDFKASFAEDLPKIEKSILGKLENHITEPTYGTSTTLDDAYITVGTVYDISSTVANSAVESEIGNIKVKNDTLKINNKTVIDSTEKETSGTDPVTGNIPGKSAAGTVTVKVAEQQIPEEKTNIKYDSKGEITYVLKEEYPSKGHSSKLTIDIPDINSVKVHTPVLCKITIAEDNLKYVQDVNADKTKAHAVVGRSDSDGSEGYENSTSDFVINVDVNGTHINEKGYKTRSDYDKYIVGHGNNVNGTNYPKGVMVNFPFDVVADVGGDGNEANDIVISKDTWTRMYPSFYVPEWVEPGSYKVKVCVYAINALGKEDKEQKNKNTTDTNYVAYDEAEIEISGKVYGLTLTSNTSTAPDWKDVFLSSGRIKWAYPNKYPDGTYIDGFDKSKLYYYMTGIKNELGLDMKTLVSQTVKVKGKDTVVTTLETKRDRYIFPLIDGSSPATKGTGTLKSGYTWNFQISTAGRVTANDNSTLVIVPTFYWIGSSGTKREKVDVWYSGKVDGKTYNFIKVGSELDKKNVFSDYALSETMGIPKSELAMVETLRGDKKVLQANTNIYTYGMISLGRNTKTFPNEKYVSLFKNKGTGFTENQLMQFRQNWYFKYSMPDIYHICAAGTDVEAYAKKHGGVTYKEDFWKKKGFLVIHFDIGVYDKNGKLVLTYTNTAQNVADGMCDMWNMEGYMNNRTDTNGNNFTFVDGDVILLRLPGSTTPGTPDDPDDPPVTPPVPTPPPGTPGDPNPPTNSSEDKQVNRTN